MMKQKANNQEKVKQIISKHGKVDNEVISYLTSVIESINNRNEWDSSFLPLLEEHFSDKNVINKISEELISQFNIKDNNNSNVGKNKGKEEEDKKATQKSNEKKKKNKVESVTLAQLVSNQQEQEQEQEQQEVEESESKTNKSKKKEKKKEIVTITPEPEKKTKAQIQADSLQALNDHDAYSSAWNEALKTGRKWGGRARGGRQIRRGEGDDVHVYNITLGFPGQKEMLINADLKLVRKRRYGLIGNNGVGKSVFLRRIAAGCLPGFSRHLRTYYVEQELDGSDKNALDEVLSCDPNYEEIEERLVELEEKLEAAKTDKDREDLIQEISDLEDMKEDYNEDKRKKRAESALHSLGFTKTLKEIPTKNLSGGWKMRVSLACAVFIDPDVLMLDEPTNHLDLQTVGWLEDWLVSYTSERDTILLVVSHDRSFLSKVATDIIEFSNQKLNLWEMDYVTYLETKKEKALRYANQADALERKRAHLESSIKKMEQQSHADEKKSNQLASRVKKLDRIGNEKTDDGKRWKVSTMGYRNGSLDEEFYHVRGSDKKVDHSKKSSGGGSEASFRVKFNEPPLLTIGDVPILQLRDVGFKWEGANNYLFRNVTMSVRMGDRIAIVGENGKGKSTLLGILAETIKPTEGERIQDRKVRIGYYSQHCVNDLPLNQTALYHLKQLFPEKSETDIRKHLGSYKLPKELVERDMGLLSGGQRARVVFAAVTFIQPHILILDEPTNHLDVQTIDSLGEALGETKSCVIVVSHNRDLINAMGEPQLWHVHDRKITQFSGSVDDFKAAARSQSSKRDVFNASLAGVVLKTPKPVAQGNFM